MKKYKIVFTAGVFDLLHPGHIRLLKKASELGDGLIVGVQSDESVFIQKGRSPILDEKHRKEMLLSLPYVQKVTTYSHDRYKETINKIKPDIVVQGGDWFETGDRTEIMDLFENKGIKFKQFQYTKGISTTEIKRRIIDNSFLDLTFNYPISNLIKKIKIISINKLSLYEKYSTVKVDKIVKNIKKTHFFRDPIVVGHVNDQNGEKFIVIDGANRLEALRTLNAKNVLAFVIPYFNDEYVKLLANRHFINLKNLSKIRNFFSKEQCSSQGEKATLQIGKEKFRLVTKQNLDDIELLNSLVNSYKDNISFSRLSEIDTLSENDIVIHFKKFTKSDILELVNRDKMLESGITWHKLNFSLIRVNIPFEILINDLSESYSKKYLSDFLRNKEDKLALRRYPNPVITFDEW